MNIDDSSQLKKFNILSEDNKIDKTEGEFVFSENAMIENLSYYNESLQEQLRKKKNEDNNALLEDT